MYDELNLNLSLSPRRTRWLLLPAALEDARSHQPWQPWNSYAHRKQKETHTNDKKVTFVKWGIIVFHTPAVRFTPQGQDGNQTACPPLTPPPLGDFQSITSTRNPHCCADTPIIRKKTEQVGAIPRRSHTHRHQPNPSPKKWPTASPRQPPLQKPTSPGPRLSSFEPRWSRRGT